jgi:integrase
LLTGGRRAEVLGLEVDIDLTNSRVTFRPNQWRRLKTKKSARTVRLWPQLKEILVDYFRRQEQEGKLGTLLFPSHVGGKEQMLSDVRKVFRRVTRRAKLHGITLHVLRHTYISTRIQTLDRGRPVAAFTVAREVGHSSTAMIERTYGHLSEARHRANVVEYRVRRRKARTKQSPVDSRHV